MKIEKKKISNLFRNQTFRKWITLAAVGSTNLGGFILGAGFAFPSPIAENIKEIALLNENTFPIFASMFTFGAVFGTVISHPILVIFGRKGLITLSTIPGVVGWLTIILANSAVGLIAGRTLSGIGAGIITMVVPMYASEISEAGTRGRFSSLYGFFIALGSFGIFGTGIFLPYTWLAIVPIAALVIIALFYPLLPYSPVWLAKKGLEDSTKQTLKCLRGPNYDIEKEYREIINAVKINSKETKKSFMQPHIFKALLVALIFAIFTQFTGIGILSSYSSIILMGNSLLTPNIAATLASVGQIVGGVVCLALIDKLGRKILNSFATVSIIAIYCVLTVYFILRNYSICNQIEISTITKLNDTSSKLERGNTSTNATISSDFLCVMFDMVPIMSLCFFNIVYMIGWGQLSWVLVGEIFPTSVKLEGTILHSVVRWMTNSLTIFVFPYYTELVGYQFTFLTLAIINIISLLFMVLLVPETKNKRIEEIEDLFKRPKLKIKDNNKLSNN